MPPGLGYINPAIILRAMQQRGLMPKGPAAAQFQNGPPPVGPGGMQMIAPQDVTSALPQRGMPPQQAQGGVMGFLNKPGVREAMMQMGSSLLAQKDQAGSLGGAIGRAMPGGMQAYQQGKQGAALDEAFKDAPASMRSLLAGLDRNAQQGLAGQMLMQQLNPQTQSPVALSAGSRLVDPTTGQVVADNPAAPAAPSAGMQELQMWMEAHPEMSPAEAQASYYAAKRAPGTTVTQNAGTVETAAQRAIGEQVAQLVGDESARMRQSSPVISSIDRAIEITDSEAFESVTGPTRAIGEVFAAFAADPTTRQLKQEFDLITGAIQVDKLEAFTGPKTDTELAMAGRLASGDRSMTADELQTGLNYIKRVMEAEQVDWAERMLSIDPQLYGIDPRHIEQQRQMARQILQKYNPYAEDVGDGPGRFSGAVPGGG